MPKDCVYWKVNPRDAIIKGTLCCISTFEAQQRVAAEDGVNCSGAGLVSVGCEKDMVVGDSIVHVYIGMGQSTPMITLSLASIHKEASLARTWLKISCKFLGSSLSKKKGSLLVPY